MHLKILSFDIEVLTEQEDRFPTPERNPIIMISFDANYEIMNGKKKVVFILNRDKEIGDKQIINNNIDNVLLRFNDERKMILGWATLVKACDVLTGYNIAGFDIPYTVDRLKTLKMQGFKIGNSDDYLWSRKHVSKGLTVTTIGGIKGKLLFDVLYLLRRNDASNTIKSEYNLKDLTLKWTAKEVLGVEKLDFPISEMIKYWKTGQNEAQFIDYCSRDSELALMFIQKFRLLDKFIMLSRRSGKLTQDIIDSQGFGGLVENLLLKEFGKADRVVPCRSGRSYEGVESDLEGAYVLDPKLGITDDLGSCDYSSLYPSLMIKNNLCYTTVIKDKSIKPNDLPMNIIENEDGVPFGRFVKSSVHKGIVPTILEGLMTERKSLKAEMKKYEKGTLEYMMYDAGQNAAKILLNSHYGYTGERGAKLYCWEVASSVTGSGRKQIKGTINTINNTIITLSDNKSYKMRVVMGDTDSSYVQVIPTDPKEILTRDTLMNCMTQVIAKVNATLEKPMQLAFENYIKRILVTAKKRYTMLTVDEKGKTSIINKGIESVRSDWCDFATEALDKTTEIILNEPDIRTGVDRAVKFIVNEAETLRSGKIKIQKLALSKKLSKPLTAYDAKAAHVQVARKMMSRGKKVEIGDRISYFIMNNGSKLISDKAEETDYVLSNKTNDKVDYEYYIQDQLLPPIVRILDVLNVDSNILYQDKRQTSLADFD